jgi:hypothetical protein
MSFSERGPRQFYSGTELEADIFGKPKFAKAYEEAYKKAAAERGYLPYGRAQEIIREFYPEDPTNPKKEFAKDLRLEICDRLELDEEEADCVKFYSAVGTALDRFHGVDGWFEIDLDSEEFGTLHAEVTMDATKRPDKLEDGYKADMVVGEIPAPDEDGYLEATEKYADQASEILMRKLQKLSHARRRNVA